MGIGRWLRSHSTFARTHQMYDRMERQLDKIKQTPLSAGQTLTAAQRLRSERRLGNTSYWDNRNPSFNSDVLLVARAYEQAVEDIETLRASDPQEYPNRDAEEVPTDAQDVLAAARRLIHVLDDLDGFPAELSSEEILLVARAYEQATLALKKAHGFASIVNDRIMGPLSDDTRWAIRDLVRILHADIDAALAAQHPTGGADQEDV